MKLFDHTNPALSKDNQLAVIRAFPEEDFSEGSLLDDLAFRFWTYRIKERYDMNFGDYIALPMPVARKLDKMAERIKAPMEKEEEQRRKAALEEIPGVKPPKV